MRMSAYIGALHECVQMFEWKLFMHEFVETVRPCMSAYLAACLE